jgi:hypothetical protein
VQKRKRLLASGKSVAPANAADLETKSHFMSSPLGFGLVGEGTTMGAVLWRVNPKPYSKNPNSKIPNLNPRP